MQAPVRLVAWDFDLSLFSAENTDTFVVKHFARPHYERLKGDGQWTDKMSAALGALHREHGVTADRLREALVGVPFENAALVRRLAEREGMRQVIVSDANSVFIEAILEHHGLRECFDAIFTNPATIAEDGCVSVAHYHKNDSCALCPVNLCKGSVLEAYAAEHNISDVWYVGDGGGDLHPCLLPVVKHRIARRDYALAKLLTSRGVDHHTWETPAELAAVFDSIK
jgi:pyridoxal phosphate phosphatase PHOSPHO2